jgi:flagellar basal body-associated protein FliL
MEILGILALGATSDGTIRLVLLLLMVLAVILIVTGCIIALFTWRKRLKTQKAYTDSSNWNNRT